jgi:hypothetical protein
VAELWPEYNVNNLAVKEPGSAGLPPLHEGEDFILDWSHTVSEDRIRQFLQGRTRTPKQLRDITNTWELNRNWNHGNTPDSSIYTKRIVEEALWLRPHFGWRLQDVVDIVITFCKKNKLQWSFGRAKKQIADGQHYISLKTCQRPGACVACVAEFATSISPQQTPTLTCNDTQIIREQNRPSEPTLTGRMVNDIRAVLQPLLPDSLHGSHHLADVPKLSGGFAHKSAVRDAVLEAITKHPGWVKATNIGAETGMSTDAIRKQLQRLAVAGLVDRDGKGRYRKHRERQHRKLKPCGSKPIPVRLGTNKERKTQRI